MSNDPQNTGFEWDDLMHAYLRSAYNKRGHKPKIFTPLYLKRAYFLISPSVIITSFEWDSHLFIPARKVTTFGISLH